MPDVKEKDKDNLFEQLPNEILNNIFNYLPRYSLVGKDSIHTVSKQWNDALPKNPSNYQLISSIRTEEEAMLLLENARIFDEMDYTWFLRLVLKIERVRDILLPKLNASELYSVASYDVDIARIILGRNLGQFTDDFKLRIRSFHESLCYEYMESREISAREALTLSSVHISIASYILNTPKKSEKFTNTERFNILRLHHSLDVENLKAYIDLIDKNMKSKFAVAYFNILVREHHHPAVLDFLVTRYSEIFINHPDTFGTICVYDLERARQLFSQDLLVKQLSKGMLLELVSAHFEIAEICISNPDLIVSEYYPDMVFQIIMNHFPRSLSLLRDGKYQFRSDFYQQYGPVLELPRMVQVLTSEGSSGYDFKVALAHSLFENPELMFQHNKTLMILLKDIIDELEKTDLLPIQQAIINLFSNEKHLELFDKILALKLIGKMPFLFDLHLVKHKYFEMMLKDESEKLEDYSYKCQYLPHHPILCQKIMDNRALFPSFDFDKDGFLKRGVEIRETAKQIVQQMRCEKVVEKCDRTLKP